MKNEERTALAMKIMDLTIEGREAKDHLVIWDKLGEIFDIAYALRLGARTKGGEEICQFKFITKNILL